MGEEEAGGCKEMLFASLNMCPICTQGSLFADFFLIASNLALTFPTSFLNIHFLSFRVARITVFSCGDIFRSPLTHFHHLYPGMLYAHLQRISVRGEAGGSGMQEESLWETSGK